MNLDIPAKTDIFQILDCSRAMFHEVVQFLQKSLILKGRVHGGLAQGLLLFYFSEQLNQFVETLKILKNQS